MAVLHDGAEGSEGQIMDDTETDNMPSLDFFDASTSELIDGFCTVLEGPKDFATASQEVAKRAKRCLKVLLTTAVSSLRNL